MENIPFCIDMTPDIIDEHAVVHGQDIQFLQERGSPPPSYGDHISDPVFVECPGYSRYPSLCMEQEPSDFIPSGGVSGDVMVPAYCY